MDPHIDEPRTWAEENFASATLGDRRRNARLVRTATELARRPEGSLPQHFDPAALDAVYRLCGREEVTHQAITAPHFANTRLEAGRSRTPVLILHDTTELNYTSHQALSGTGPIGNGRGRGLLQHNSLAVDADSGLVIGLTNQIVLEPPAAPEGETRARRDRRDRRSRLWEKGIRAAGPAPARAVWVDVADRDADNFEAMRAAIDLGHEFLFRGYHDRKIFVGGAPTEGPRRLPSWARSLPARGSKDVVIPARGGRPERTAHVEMAGAAAWFPRPERLRREDLGRDPIRAWVVRVWEPRPPRGAEPLEWILISSMAAEDEAALGRHCDWYARRPLIEVYHQIEKTGCGEEDLRFRTADRLGAMLGVLAVVAVRMLQLRWWGREGADAKASAASTEEERRALKGLGERVTTARDFVRAVAKLGGFLGRKGDGEPGWQVLWRGYSRLQDVMLGMRLKSGRLRIRPEPG